MASLVWAHAIALACVLPRVAVALQSHELHALNLHSRGAAAPSRSLVRNVVTVQPAAAEADRTRKGGARYRQVMHNWQHWDVQYVADIVVGGQEMTGILDTGSFELVVMSKTCTVCGPEPERLYDKSASATFTQGSIDQTHSYGSGDLFALEGTERVSVGPLLSVDDFSFWEVYDANMSILEHSDIQAIVGVGPPGLPQLEASYEADADNTTLKWLEKSGWAPKALKRSAERKANSSAQELQRVSEKQDSLLEAFDTMIFSVCLQKARGSQGYFIWNDNDPTKKVDLFKQLPVSGTFTWGVTLNRVRLESSIGSAATEVGCYDGCGAIVDSGTSLLVMPRKAAENLKKAIDALGPFNCSNILGDDFWDRMPRLNFDMGGHELSLGPEAYLGQFVSPVRHPVKRFLQGRLPVFCGYELIVMTEDSETQFGPLWIVGMPFFREYYTTFDLGDVGRTSTIQSDDNVRPRSLFVANSDGVCSSPGEAPEGEDLVYVAPSSDKHNYFRRVNASQIQMPLWVSALYDAQLVHI